MMPFSHLLTAAFLLQFAAGSICAAESVVDIGSFRLTLPDGYTNHDEHGMDSRTGYITIKDKLFKIEYDTFDEGGPTTLSGFGEDMLDAMIYYELTQEDQVSACITASLRPNVPEKPIVTLWVRGLASFNIQTSDKAEVKDAVTVLRAIKVTKPRGAKP
jgi:hypothetical protein